MQQVVTGFPEGLVPVLVSVAEGAAASDFLRTEAFRMLTIVLNRYLPANHILLAYLF